MVATDRGQRPVETLRRGDKVVTRDNGLRRIHWVGKRVFNYQELQQEDCLRPFVIRAGAFGEGRPFRDMIVSPNHRFLIGGEYSPLPFESDEALRSASLLKEHRGVSQAAMLGVTYVHIMCARHEVILADGVWTESFHPDDVVMKGLGKAQRRELITLFPEIETIGAARRFPSARPISTPQSKFEL